MQPRYNIYFAGEILDGQDLATVRSRLAKLFNAGDATLDKLFSGTPQLVKRDCDKPTALKYKQAMEKAGAKPLIKAAQQAETAPPPDAKQPAPAAPEKTMSMAERIAALAAAPDVAYGKERDQVAEAQSAPQAADPGSAAAPQPGAATPGGLSLAPGGGELLAPAERPQAPARLVEVGNFETEGDYGRLSAEAPPPPPAPSTDHLHMGEPGETIPTLPRDQAPLSPNTDGISLSPEGTDFSDCASVDEEFPELDLTAMSVAPEGSDMLESEYRRSHDEAAPDTSHLSVQGQRG